MLLDCDTGVSGKGRLGISEQRGNTKLVRFSYRANRRSILAGILDCTDWFLDDVEASYAETALLFKWATSKR